MSYRSTFIASPASDTFFLLACPLLALGGLLLLLENGIISLTAFVAFTAIYTGAHHLPGFLRAYGTREIFDANRARLVLAPILIFATLGILEWQGVRGYIIVLWFFNWWHTAMQNYGLMRIYERKSLPAVSYSVKLDLISVIVWHFTATELLSDDMRFDLSQHLFNLGVTNAFIVSFSLWSARAIAVAASLVLLLLYIRNSIAQFRANSTVALNKQIFLLGTYGLYFYMFFFFTKDISTSVESFFHNTQYVFFAWIMQRRLAEKAHEGGSQFNWFGSLFSIRRNRPAVLLYIAAIGAWGYLVGGSIKPRIGTETLIPLFNVFYATSAFLHYYTDSFIWKARTKEMSATLGLKGGSGLEMSPRSYAFSLKEVAAMLLIPMVLATLLTNPKNPGHDNVRQNPDLAMFSAAVLADRPRWPSAAVAAADVGDFIAATDPPQAVAWYQRAVAARGEYADAYQALGHVYSQQRQHQEAAQAYEQAVKLDPTFTASWNNLGNAYAGMGQLDRARTAYERALTLDPELLETRLNLGQVFIGLADAAAARQSFEHALRIDANSTDAYRGLAHAASLEGKHDEAIAHFRKVAALTPDSPAAHLELSKALFNKGDFSEAEKGLDALIRLTPRHAAGYIGKAEVLLSQNRTAGALALLEEAVRIEPGSGEAHATLGVAYVKAGRLEDALKHLEEAVKIDPNLPDAYYELAGIWEKRGDRNIAIMYLNQAARYNHSPAQRRLQELLASQRGSD